MPLFKVHAIVFAAFASLSYANPVVNSALNKLGIQSIFEQVTVPTEWAHVGVPHPESVMTMQIGLKQADMPGLEKKLLKISQPDSGTYGQWLSKDEMEKYTSPAKETVDLVRTWLAAFGIDKNSISQPTPDWMEVRVPISKAEIMLTSKYAMFKDSVTGKTVPRATEYSIPLLLHDHVDTIQPTTAFHRPLGVQRAENTTEAVHSKRTTCDPNNGKASLAVTGFIDYSASHRDAATFISEYDPSSSGADFKDGSISGAQNNPSNPTLEGNLDTQIALTLGYPNPVTYYAVGPNDDPDNQFGDELVNFGNYLNSAANPPTSVSTSYGGEEQGFSSNYLDRICNEFMKAGSRGVSIFFSSGDFGVGGNGEPNCNQGFYALFPASCPYITSVGATQFSDGGEIAAEFDRNGSTGGGFSWHFSAPSYQTSDTKSYIQDNLDNSYDGYYNVNGRGYPDIALIGEYYDIVLNGGTQRVYGTSASSPAWAALVSLINDYRLSNGKSTLGFLNPLLYQSSAARSALIDITSGHNRGCGEYGYPASTGWDPTTGLGTMNFGKLRQALA